jgi:hypothetical protein
VGNASTPHIIGLTGFAQHGKDSVGAFLVERYGYTRFAFADQLREMAYRLNPIIDAAQRERYQDNIQSGREDVARWMDFDRLADKVDRLGWDVAKQNPEIRRTLQVLGTECVRDILGDQSWINALENRLNAFGSWSFPDSGAIILPGARSVFAGPPAVITDVRFPNEASAVRTWGGEIWRIVRTRLNGTLFDNGLGIDHPSEKFIDGIRADMTITAWNLDQLRMRVKRAMTW